MKKCKSNSNQGNKQLGKALLRIELEPKILSKTISPNKFVTSDTVKIYRRRVERKLNSQSGPSTPNGVMKKKGHKCFFFEVRPKMIYTIFSPLPI